MGFGGVAIAALPTVMRLKVPFSDGLGGDCKKTAAQNKRLLLVIVLCVNLTKTFWILLGLVVLHRTADLLDLLRQRYRLNHK